MSSNNSSSLKILALGDAHFQTNNIREVNIFLDKLKQYITKNMQELDIICIMGDILHTHERLNITPLNKAIEFVELCASMKPTYVIVGNHDCEFNSIFLTTNHWLNCLKNKNNIKIIDNVTIETIKEQKIVFCPYVPDGRFIEALNTKKTQWEDSKCIFSHVTIRDCKMGTIIAKDADEWKEEYPFLISGHIHGSQWVGKNMFYTGSILQVSVDEDPEKYIILVTISSKDKPDIQCIDLQLPKKKIIYVDISEIDEYKVPNEPETTYSLYLIGNYEQFKAFRKSNKYKELQKFPQIGSSKNIKFKPNKLDIKNNIKHFEDLQKLKQKNFYELLMENFNNEKDKITNKLMTSLLNNLLHNEEDLSDDLENNFII